MKELLDVVTRVYVKASSNAAVPPQEFVHLIILEDWIAKNHPSLKK